MKNYLKPLILSVCICCSLCSCGSAEESSTSSSAPVSDTTDVITTTEDEELTEEEEPTTIVEYKSREELAMDFEREYVGNLQSGDAINMEEYEKQKEEYINAHYVEKPTEVTEVQEDFAEAKAKIDEFHALTENYELLQKRDFSFDVWLYVDSYKTYDEGGTYNYYLDDGTHVEWQMYVVNDEAGTYQNISTEAWSEKNKNSDEEVLRYETSIALEYGKYKFYMFYENEKTGVYYFNVSDEFTLDENIEDYTDNGKTQKRYYFNLTDFMGDLTEKTLDK